MKILLAVLLGLAFGFVLQKIGAANPQRVIDMLRLKDLHLMKVIFLAIGTSSLAIFLMLTIGILDPTHLSVKSAYVGVFAGGMILAVGWVVSGFCPGTGVVAAGSGRKDAWFFILGGLLGAFIYMILYEYIKPTVLFESLGGKITLAATGSEKFQAVVSDISGVFIAGVIAIIFISIAYLLKSKKYLN